VSAEHSLPHTRRLENLKSRWRLVCIAWNELTVTVAGSQQTPERTASRAPVGVPHVVAGAIRTAVLVGRTGPRGGGAQRFDIRTQPAYEKLQLVNSSVVSPAYLVAGRSAFGHTQSVYERTIAGSLSLSLSLFFFFLLFGSSSSGMDTQTAQASWKKMS
jgi:hypothetical protein